MEKMNKFYLTFVVTSVIMMTTFLIGCGASKNAGCDAYSDSYIIRTDSTVIKVSHCHINEERYCFYTVDTIRLTK